MGRPKESKYHREIDGQMHKECRGCGEWKTLDQFYAKNHDGYGGLGPRCVACVHDKYVERKPALKVYHEKRRLEFGSYNKEYYEANKERIMAQQKKSRRKPDVKARAHAAFHGNPHRKISRTLRIRMLHALSGHVKSEHTFELIGCDVESLIKHLESLFQPGMTWDNHGRPTLDGPRKWQIDHKIPCAVFDLSDPDQQKACFNWQNLQPLWADQNASKGASVVL